MRVEQINADVVAGSGRRGRWNAMPFGTMSDGPRLDADLMFEDVFKEIPPHLVRQRAQLRSERS